MCTWGLQQQDSCGKFTWFADILDPNPKLGWLLWHVLHYCSIFITIFTLSILLYIPVENESRIIICRMSHFWFDRWFKKLMVMLLGIKWNFYHWQLSCLSYLIGVFSCHGDFALVEIRLNIAQELGHCHGVKWSANRLTKHTENPCKYLTQSSTCKRNLHIGCLP